MRSQVAGLLISVAFSGACAGLHVVPQQNYSVTPAGVKHEVVRVAFDQDGDPYPASPPAIMPRPPIMSVGLSAYTVKDRFGTNFVPERRIAEVADSINSSLMRTRGPLIILIHGYNNSFKAAESSYREIVASIDEVYPERRFTFLQVYWDGIYRGPFTAPLPFAYWFDATTYSNLAGQHGLRSILNRITRDTPVRVITHSRGAAVALSALVNPYYDAGIEPGTAESLQYQTSADVVLGMIAPAVGWAHIDSLVATPPPFALRVVIGFNASDPTLRKAPLGAQRWGTTELGTDTTYFRVAERQLEEAGIEADSVDFTGMRAHPLRSYLSNREKAHRFVRLLAL